MAQVTDWFLNFFKIFKLFFILKSDCTIYVFLERKLDHRFLPIKRAFSLKRKKKELQLSCRYVVAVQSNFSVGFRQTLKTDFEEIWKLYKINKLLGLNPIRAIEPFSLWTSFPIPWRHHQTLTFSFHLTLTKQISWSCFLAQRSQ